MNSTTATVLKNPLHLLAFGLGSGLAPKAPGTWGTLAAVPLWYGLQMLPLPLYLLVLLLAFVLGIYLCAVTSRALGVHDHGGIVWDEFVGFWLTMTAVPAEPLWVVTGFLLFRLFDIWKPWPIRVLDRNVHGGLGIMIDDVVAGLYALFFLQLAYRFLQ